jgi:hypothetical protein
MATGVYTDAINSTVATVDQTGSVKGQFLYEPFRPDNCVWKQLPFPIHGANADFSRPLLLPRSILCARFWQIYPRGPARPYT